MAQAVIALALSLAGALAFVWWAVRGRLKAAEQAAHEASEIERVKSELAHAQGKLLSFTQEAKAQSRRHRAGKDATEAELARSEQLLGRSPERVQWANDTLKRSEHPANRGSRSHQTLPLPIAPNPRADNGDGDE